MNHLSKPIIELAILVNDLAISIKYFKLDSININVLFIDIDNSINSGLNFNLAFHM